MKKIVIINPSMQVEKVSPLEAVRISEENISELLAQYSECNEEDELEYIDAELDYWNDIWTRAHAEMKNARYIIGYDCLLEGVFVPNMEDRMQKKSMQQRFREMEPDVFDSVVSQEQLNDWIYC